MIIRELLDLAIKNNASDLHIMPGMSPSLRIDGNLSVLTNYPLLSHGEVEEMIFSVLSAQQKELLLSNKELDFSMGVSNDPFLNSGRFRVNVYFQKGYLSGAFRYLPPKIKTIEELNLLKICHSFSNLKQGLVLVTGPTGHGKSSTLAAIINEINLTRYAHILTIEDPIEYVYPVGKSVVSQREMGSDTYSWSKALRSALREDPDVVLIGEMRDEETIASAITIAETGHLVFSTLHTNSASQSIDRILDVFSSQHQKQVRAQLAATLKGIISQRLIPQIGGGRIPVMEILIGNSAIASNIREGKTHLIDSVIQTSQDMGMVTLEASLASLVRSGVISIDSAKDYALHQDELLRLIG